MVHVVSPTHAEFLATTFGAFRFLEAYGCGGPEEHPHDPYHVVFRCRHCIVHVVGRSFGFALDVYIRRPGYELHSGRYHGIFPLGALLKIRAPDLYDQRFFHTSGQLKMIRMDAAAIEAHAQDLLLGDFSVGPQIERLLRTEAAEAEARWKQEEEDLCLRHAILKANEAFRARDYQTVVQTLLEFESRLTRSQAMKLRYAQKRLPRNWLQKILGRNPGT